MFKTGCFTLLGCALFSSFVTPAYAGNRAGALSMSGGVGYLFFDAKRDINNAGMPYAELGYNMTQHWGVSGLLGVFSTHSNNDNDGRRVDGTEFALDVVYHFSPIYARIEPFVLAGPGIASINPPTDTYAHTQGNVNAGAGVQIFVDPSVAFKLEARDFYQIVSSTNDVFLDAGVSFLLDLC